MQVSVLINRNRLKRLRNFTRRYPGKVPDMLRRRVKPVVEKLVKTRLAKYPYASKHPFVFATPRSARYWFVNARKGSIRTIAARGGDPHYARTRKMEKAWEVVIDARANDNLITISNHATYQVNGQVKTPSGFVYGKGGSFRQVPGFKNTGWGENFNRDMKEITKAASAEIGEGLKQIEKEESDA